MNVPSKKGELSFVEFVIIISIMMSLTALSIDAMLPALPDIGNDLGVQNVNDRQLVVSMLFLGLALGQLFFGPLSDSIGRKKSVYAGFFLYLVGLLLSVLAVDFEMMIAGRIIQGLGISSPRSNILAIVRDKYSGRAMARVMSFVMTVFILIPMVAPSLGQVILMSAGWRSIFICFAILTSIVLIWFFLRMPETLPEDKRAPFSLKHILKTVLEVVKIRTAIGHTIATGLISGAFLGYLNSSQQIFQEQYALGERFPLFFAMISLSIGLASLLNSRLVTKYGMRFLVRWSLYMIFSLAVIGLIVVIPLHGHPPLWFLLAYIMLTFFCIGILFGNQNSLAMEPLGHLAGVGSAIVGSISTLISMPLGTLIGQSYNGTILPLVTGLAVLSFLTILVFGWAEAKRPIEQKI